MSRSEPVPYIAVDTLTEEPHRAVCSLINKNIARLDVAINKAMPVCRVQTAGNITTGSHISKVSAIRLTSNGLNAIAVEH